MNINDIVCGCMWIYVHLWYSMIIYALLWSSMCIILILIFFLNFGAWFGNGASYEMTVPEPKGCKLWNCQLFAFRSETNRFQLVLAEVTRKACVPDPEPASQSEMREEDLDLNADLRRLEPEDKEDVLPMMHEMPSSKRFDEDLPATLGVAMCPC